MASFDEVLKDCTKLGTKIQTSEYLKNGTYPIIDQGQDNIAGYFDTENGLFKDVPAIVFGDHTRIVKYIDKPCFLGADGVKLLCPVSKDTNCKYLFYQLAHADIPNTGYNRHFKWVKALNFKIPSSDEQNHVVEVLDKATELISLRKQQLARLDELVKARFVEMFGDAKLNPYDFPCNSLSEYILFLTSGSRGWSQYFTDNGEYFITIKNVKNCRITLQDVQYVIPPDNAEAKRTKVQENDLLISITADLGRTGVVPKEIAKHGAYINQHLTCIRLNLEKVNPIYVAYYMESDAGKEQFASKNQSAVKAGLNFNAINSLKLIVPPLSLQNDFAAFVERVDQQKQTVQQSLEKLELMKKALMQEYFG
jgi:type I restriction enzyme, S subunit